MCDLLYDVNNKIITVRGLQRCVERHGFIIDVNVHFLHLVALTSYIKSTPLYGNLCKISSTPFFKSNRSSYSNLTKNSKV